MLNDGNGRFTLVWWQFTGQLSDLLIDDVAGTSYPPDLCSIYLIVHHETHQSRQEFRHYLTVKFGFFELLRVDHYPGA